MGIFDKAKEALGAHPEQVGKGIDKLADLADQRTGGKYTEHIDRGQELARERLAGQADTTPPTSAEPR